MDTPPETHRDYTGSKVGMWLFLLTEILLFGVLFLIYSVYRSQHSESFHAAAQELNITIGTINTVILLSSSLSMALSISAVKKGSRRLAGILIWVTVLLAIVFIMNKYFEWGAKIRHGIYPGSPELIARDNGTVLFYGLYFVMTGLHGLHVLVGAIILSVMGYLVRSGKINRHDYVKLENSGLYWHLVDIIWIYLFPLFYLIT